MTLSSDDNPYLGDRDDDQRYHGWSYLGDRYVCPLADEHRTCHRRANQLLAEGHTDALRAMADEGHRCAFIRLLELLVMTDRVEDLYTMAQAGDDRAAVTLYEYLQRRTTAADFEQAVRPYASGSPRLTIWLALLIANDPGRVDEALTLIAPLINDRWKDQEARHAKYRIELAVGRVHPSPRRKNPTHGPQAEPH